MLCYVWSGRRESNPRHTAWEAVVLPLNYARTDSVFRHSADGVPTKTGTSVPLYHRRAAPSSSTSSTAPRSLTGRPWPPPHKRRNPAAFAGRRGKNGAGFITQLERGLSEYDLLVLRRNHADPMIVLPWRTWAALLMRRRR